ncbi:MAG: hypothetical protein H0X39_16865 [Actinobacteria bacterium]|nr:hypothetical protein [Actinomycetota bacterium]
MAEAVRVEGLRELVGALGRLDRKMGAELRRELRTRVGGEFTRDVKLGIIGQGLYRTGALYRSIRPSVSGTTLTVRSAPALRPGPRSRGGYGVIYEYTGRAGSRDGRGTRAFLNPTLDRWEATGKLEESLGGFLDFIEHEWRS